MSRFNLLSDAWIPIKGQSELIKVCDIVQADIIALDAPRADFNAALMQFLIGIVQTVFAPQNPREWRKFFESPPSESELQEKLDTVKGAFYLDGDGVRFMQDASIQEKKNLKPIEEIIFGAPGDSTKSKNGDFFVKQQDVDNLCASCSAIAVFTTNIFADQGGAGYFESMRGNGFISNLISIDEKQTKASLWRNIWLNILTADLVFKNKEQEKFLWMQEVSNNEVKRKQLTDIINKLDKKIIKYSGLIDEAKDKKELKELKEKKKEVQQQKKNTQRVRKDITGIYPENANSLLVYWAWGRRLYLQTDPCDELCSLCGKHKVFTKSVYKASKGYNYPKIIWKHPFSAYRKAESGEYEGSFLAFEMTSKGLPYIYWSDFFKTTEKQFPAQVVTQYFKNQQLKKEQLILWSFGFVMDSNSPKGWYESKTPLYFIDNENNRKVIEAEIQRYIEASNKISDSYSGYLTNAVKNAWFDENENKNKDQKKAFINNKSVEVGKYFWSQTHDKFYDLVNQLYSLSDPLNEDNRIKLRITWHTHILIISEHVFNQWAFKASIKTNPRRIALAHKQLMQNLHSKSLKQDTLGIPKEKRND
ncbi:MAG: type I-E CRISPR-associated protein Cse1/CasA [Methyloprofundus sp.]|nr:type I-E CRISPR-associated protein Cse1/CasA [Methyloprofundus sp.]